MTQPLSQLVTEVAALLRSSGQRIVFAESCTGGLVSALLARIPGISESHCGSAVVYRLDTKSKWLGVAEAHLLDPGPVSEIVAREMAVGVLARTPEADLAASITGHLGPNAPADQDGLVFMAVARRNPADAAVSATVFEHRLTASTLELSGYPGESLREQRQWRAAAYVLSHVRDELASLLSRRVIPAAES